MKTLVIGASENPTRYSFKAINSLLMHGHEVVALANRAGSLKGIDFETEPKAFADVDTITLYVNPANQLAYYEYILSLNPRRVIFNPGTENIELMELLKQKNIESVIACTLVLLSTNQF